MIKHATDRHHGGDGRKAAVAEAPDMPAASAKPVSLDELPYPYPDKLPRKEYEETLLALQVELAKLQLWVKAARQRLVIVFEGRDTAGKGGTIKRFIEHLNPRGARVVALAKPSEVERGQWYFQRYVAQLPTAGEMAFFDRSWYNRAGVEPVMGYCTPAEYLEFMRQVPEVERALVTTGIRLTKLWLDVGRDQQQQRLKARQKDILRQWKLSDLDMLSAKKWPDYTTARDRMFLYTHTTHAPWIVVRSDDKRRARINAIRQVLFNIPYDQKDPAVACAPDDQIVFSATRVLPADKDLMLDVMVRR